MKFKLSIIFILLALFFGAAVFLVGYMNWYIDIASFVLVVALPYIVTSVLFPFSNQVNFLKTASKTSQLSNEETAIVRKAILFLDTFLKFSIGCTVAAVFMGLIAIMASLDKSSSAGEGISVLLIGPFYTSLIYILLIIPYRSLLKEKLLDKQV